MSDTLPLREGVHRCQLEHTGTFKQTKSFAINLIKLQATKLLSIMRPVHVFFGSMPVMACFCISLAGSFSPHRFLSCARVLAPLSFSFCSSGYACPPYCAALAPSE